jgi:uncharacterized SAM-binding protein YcdF (DUF218 family)
LSVLTELVAPSALAYVLIAAGLLTRALASTRRFSWPLLASGGVVSLVFSSGLTAAALLSPLEYRHPAVVDAAPYNDVRQVVVLTGYAADDAAMPLTGRMNASSAFRVLMALELLAAQPDRHVIVSGPPASARIMGESLVKLGVAPEKVFIDGESRSTAQSAKRVTEEWGDEPFLLVTSAGHMPRSVEAFRARGAQPIPAPTEHLLPREWTRAEPGLSPLSLFAADLAVHEYIGRLWYRLRG